MIAVAVITAPRPTPTLEHSLRTYRMAGFSDQPLFVHAEPESMDWLKSSASPADFTLVQNAERLGNLRNWNKAARTLLQFTTEPWLMVCEDDITWARNAADVLEYDLAKLTHDKVGALSLYLPDRMAGLIAQSNPMSYNTRHQKLMYGWYRVAIGRKMWGAQCLLFKRAWLEELLGHPFWCSKLADPTVDKNVDAWIAETILTMDRTLLYRIPCLVDHVLGDRNSSLYGDKDRPQLRTRYFKETA